MNEDIIKYFEKKYPITEKFEINNLSNLNFNLSVGYFNQYIIGLTQSTAFDSGTLNYENNIRELLKPIPRENINCEVWSFSANEEEELKQNLENLSKYFNVEIDIPKMLARQDIRKNKEATYYLVVTIVQIAIAAVPE